MEALAHSLLATFAMSVREHGPDMAKVQDHKGRMEGSWVFRVRRRAQLWAGSMAGCWQSVTGMPCACQQADV